MSSLLPLVGSPTAPADTVRVLLVEDDDGDAFLVGELLGEAVHPVELVRARTLAEAEAMVGRVDCVLLDLGLPDASGLDGLRRLDALADGVALLVLTGLADEYRGVEAVAAGAQDYLVKGQVDGELLARAIRYAIGRSRLEATERALQEQQLHAEENTRLERGLLPSPLIAGAGVVFAARYQAGGRRLLLGGDFYDAVRDDGRHAARDGRRRSPGTARTRRRSASGCGSPGARWCWPPGRRRRSSRRCSRCWCTSGTASTSSRRCACSPSPRTGGASGCTWPGTRRRC